MSPFSALILGIIQGATEFLPVSSSAHLALAHWLFGWNTADNLAFDVALHFGTLIAILIYFGRDWLGLIKRGDKLLGFVLVACIPGALAGAKFEEAAESTFRSPLHIAILLAAMALGMAAAERWGKKALEIVQMRWGQAIGIGVAQALAIMPGVSRSGITMTVALACGFTREAAARFSFLLATPILLGATLYKCRHLLHGGGGAEISSVTIGVIAAAVTGLLAIHFLLQWLRSHTFYPFVIYRLALAAAIVMAVVVQAR
jgi:undecaprenyl-diphosphatase